MSTPEAVLTAGLGFAPGVHLQRDRRRGGIVLQAPERVLALSETAAELLTRLDGRSPLLAHAETLAADYDAPAAAILEDCLPLVQELLAKAYLQPDGAPARALGPAEAPDPLPWQGWPEPPLSILLELSHRCPLRCAYCSNPLALEPSSSELPEAAWATLLEEAADLGVLQVHFSGGEPLVRRDLPDLVRTAVEAGLYANLITSAVLLTPERIRGLAEAGLSHVQISFQDVQAEHGDWMAGFPAHLKKLEAARGVLQAGLALTCNLVVTRHNADRIEAMLQMALDLGATRAEVAHVQHYGWGLVNRAALIPTRAQMDQVAETVTAWRLAQQGRMQIDHVLPDYHAAFPKACMEGWGRRFLTVTPSGRVLPCHAAESIPGLDFARFPDRSLAWIWAESPAFRRFRAPDFLPEGCQTCPRATEDFGGCRCQALALTGDAAAMDPVCRFSPHHALVQALAEAEAAAPAPPLRYRQRSLVEKEREA